MYVYKHTHLEKKLDAIIVEVLHECLRVRLQLRQDCHEIVLCQESRKLYIRKEKQRERERESARSERERKREREKVISKAVYAREKEKARAQERAHMRATERANE